MNITTLKVRELATGDSLEIPIFRFKGSANGPSVYIQSSIHGAELQGNAVIYELLKYFAKNPPLGDVVLVPLVNPYGANFILGDFTYGRFDPSTGDNWNRLYWKAICASDSDRQDDYQIDVQKFVQENINLSVTDRHAKFQTALQTALKAYYENQKKQGMYYGQRLAAEIQTMAFQADIVLDLHCDTISERHIYVPKYAKDSACYFDISYLVTIDNVFSGALDEASFFPWWSLTKAEEKQGIHSSPGVESFTIELGNKELLAPAQTETDVASIIKYLQYRKVIAGDAVSPKAIKRYAVDKFYCLHTDSGGLVNFCCTLGAHYKPGDKLAEILNFRKAVETKQIDSIVSLVNAPENCIAITQSSSSAAHEGTIILKLFTNFVEL